jgi:hypothetical protein
VALRDAFNAAARSLEDELRRSDHRATHQEQRPGGKVGRLFPQDGYGFIDSDGFAKLEIGYEVTLKIAETESDNAPRARLCAGSRSVIPALDRKRVGRRAEGG